MDLFADEMGLHVHFPAPNQNMQDTRYHQVCTAGYLGGAGISILPKQIMVVLLDAPHVIAGPEWFVQLGPGR
jgi:hypothetical protein